MKAYLCASPFCSLLVPIKVWVTNECLLSEQMNKIFKLANVYYNTQLQITVVIWVNYKAPLYAFLPFLGLFCFMVLGSTTELWPKQFWFVVCVLFLTGPWCITQIGHKIKIFWPHLPRVLELQVCSTLPDCLFLFSSEESGMVSHITNCFKDGVAEAGGLQNLHHWLPSRTAVFSCQIPFTVLAGLSRLTSNIPKEGQSWGGHWASSFGVLYPSKCEVLCMPGVLGHAVFMADACCSSERWRGQARIWTAAVIIPAPPGYTSDLQQNAGSHSQGEHL